LGTCPKLLHTTQQISQDAEKVRQRRSRFAQKLNVPKRTPSPLRSLRPCWTAFLSILRGVLLLSSTCEPLNFHRATIVFPQPATRSIMIVFFIRMMKKDEQAGPHTAPPLLK